MGVSYDITPNLDLQIDYNMINYDDFESNGLRLGLRFNIIEDLIKGQVGATLGQGEYNGAHSTDQGENYIFDLGVIVDILMFDVLFSVGYMMNDMVAWNDNAVLEDVIGGPFFTIGLEIFPWD